MFAALFVVAQVIANPAPEPTRIVLDGCSTASAVRAAEIQLMPVGHPKNRVLLNELLHERDGATCLFESELVIALHHTHAYDGLVARAFAVGLDGAPHVSARAHALLGKIATQDQVGFGKLLRRIDALRNTASFVRDDQELRTVTQAWSSDSLQR